MSVKSVVVHRCQNVRYKELLVKCRCGEHISVGRAEARVGAGSGEWLVRRSGSQSEIDRGHLFVITPRWSDIPRAQAISESHVLMACGAADCSVEATRYERERIELYGEMNQVSLAELGATLKSRGEVV